MHHARNGFLTAKGLEEAAQREVSLSEFHSMGLTPHEASVILDSQVSVSGSSLVELHWDDALIEDQYRRFHNEV